MQSLINTYQLIVENKTVDNIPDDEAPHITDTAFETPIETMHAAQLAAQIGITQLSDVLIKGRKLLRSNQ